MKGKATLCRPQSADRGPRFSYVFTNGINSQPTLLYRREEGSPVVHCCLRLTTFSSLVSRSVSLSRAISSLLIPTSGYASMHKWASAPDECEFTHFSSRSSTTFRVSRCSCHYKLKYKCFQDYRSHHQRKTDTPLGLVRHAIISSPETEERDRKVMAATCEVVLISLFLSDSTLL